MGVRSLREKGGGGSEAEGEVTDEAGGKLEIQPKKYPSRVRRPPDRYGW